MTNLHTIENDIKNIKSILWSAWKKKKITFLTVRFYKYNKERG